MSKFHTINCEICQTKVDTSSGQTRYCLDCKVDRMEYRTYAFVTNRSGKTPKTFEEWKTTSQSVNIE